MYGHLSVNRLPATYPQYYARGEGARVWDIDGNEYVDLMCSFGPNILGHHHPKVTAAAQAQLALGDTLAGPGAVAVELAELLVERIGGATWAMFAKNGTDATHLSVTIAKAQTGRKKVLQATGAYHGIAPWCWIPGDMDPEDHANMRYFTFNDLDSVVAAVDAADGEVAGIVVSPFKHDAGFDQELTDPDFALGVRAICDDIGAMLIVDEVRAGFRLNHGGSWESFGVTPDLSGWSKGIANGFALAAVWLLGPRVLPGVGIGAAFVMLQQVPPPVALTGLLAPVALALALFHKAPVLLTLLATIPLALSGLTVLLDVVLLAQFGQTFGERVRLRDYAGLVLGAYPFQVVLSVAAVWATARFTLGRNDWVKTRHQGVHLGATAAGSRQPALAEKAS